MTGVRIVIVEGQEFVLHGLASVISRARPDWTIAGLAMGSAEALEIARNVRPNCAVLDLNLPVASELEVAQGLIEAIPDIRILALTTVANETLLGRLQNAGLRGCIAIQDVADGIVSALEVILNGEPFFVPPRTLELAGRVRSPNSNPVRDVLTAREMTVMRLLAEGRSNKCAAAELGLSARTVETHRANLLNKLGIDSIVDLVRIAVREKLI